MSDGTPLLPPFAALKAFEAYGRLNGVRRAAKALGVSHVIISRHLRTLEAWLGVALIERPGGALTPAGVDYHRGIAAAIQQLRGVTDTLLRSHASRLEVWCVPGFAYLWLTTRLRAFSERHPAIALDLRPTDASPVMPQHQADADIRYRRDGDATDHHPGVRLTQLARPRVFPVANPAMAAALNKRVHAPADLIDCPLLHEENDRDWNIWFAAQGVNAPLKAPTARLWQAHIAIAAARDGQGVALTNGFLSHDDLAAGRLVELGAGDTAFPPVAIGDYLLIARADRWNEGAFAKFRRWLEATASEAVDLHG